MIEICLICKKHSLKKRFLGGCYLKISSGIVENIFDLPSLAGDVTGGIIVDVDDTNFMSLLESESLTPAHYRFIGYYQNKDFQLPLP